jgi:nucleotide-binding universal stress UspA family protein
MVGAAARVVPVRHPVPAPGSVGEDGADLDSDMQEHDEIFGDTLASTPQRQRAGMADQVILALDGSAKDERALAVAEAVSELTGAALHLVRVIGTPGKKLSAESEVLGVEEARVTGRREVELELTGAAARVTNDTQGDVTWGVIEGSNVAEELVRCAAERDALLVVMATRAAGTAGRALRGSVADQVMRECPRPVMLVPPGTEYAAGKRLRFARVLVPLDGSPLASRALDYVLRLPRAAQLEYALLEVVRGDDARPGAAERVEEAARRVRSAGARIVDSDVAVASEPAPVIVEAVREALVDLIAMSSRGAGGLRRLVLGSVAQGVIRACEVPVLLLTPASLE